MRHACEIYYVWPRKDRYFTLWIKDYWKLQVAKWLNFSSWPYIHTSQATHTHTHTHTHDLSSLFSHSYSVAAAKSLQSCLTLRPHRLQPTRLFCPWDSPGKNTGVGCHFLLQCVHARLIASVMSDSMGPCGQQSTRFLCPQDSLGKNTYSLSSTLFLPSSSSLPSDTLSPSILSGLFIFTDLHFSAASRDRWKHKPDPATCRFKSFHGSSLPLIYKSKILPTAGKALDSLTCQHLQPPSLAFFPCLSYSLGSCWHWVTHHAVPSSWNITLFPLSLPDTYLSFQSIT